MSAAPTRRELLIAGAGAAAAAGLLQPAPVLAAMGPPTNKPHGSGGADESEAMRVHRLLSVELLILYTYDHILGSSILPPPAQRALEPLRAHEEAHVRALRASLDALGGTAPVSPTNVVAADRDLARRSVRGRLGQLQGRRDALRLLLAVERVVVGAYFVALLKLEDKQVISLAAQIMAVDAQHEAVIGELLHPGQGQTAAPYGLVQGVQ